MAEEEESYEASGEDWSDEDRSPGSHGQRGPVSSSGMKRGGRLPRHHHSSAPAWQLLQPPKLPTYSGVGDCEDFINEVQRILDHQNLAPGSAAEWIIQALSGSARREVLARPTEESSTPKKVLHILRDTFGDVQGAPALISAFHGRRQRCSERVLEFAQNIQILAKRANSKQAGAIPDPLVRDHFIDALASTELRRSLKRTVRDQPATTFLEVRAQALTWEREEEVDVQVDAQAASITATPTAEMQEMRNQISSLTSLVNQLQADLDGRKSNSAEAHPSPPPRSVTCFYCGKRGHVKAECHSWRRDRRSAPSGRFSLSRRPEQEN